jgi:two-component system NtrC family sensor kinase
MPSKPPMPVNEPDRLQALLNYHILDTEAEQNFDDLTKLASHVCGTPIALVSLIDADRQWFKSRVGLDARQTPREFAFCAHTIMDEQPLVVADPRSDERFKNNPLVLGDPKIRFCAGAPLQTPHGHNIGTLCVIDQVARQLTPEQIEALKALARQVVSQLELRETLHLLERKRQQTLELTNSLHQANQELTQIIASERAARTQLRGVIDYSSNFVAVLGIDGIVLDANHSSLAKAGIEESDVIHQPLWQTPWWSHSQELQERLKQAIHLAASGKEALATKQWVTYR